MTHVFRIRLAGALLLLGTATSAVLAGTGPAQQAIIANFAAQAKAADPTFSGFSAQRGEAFFHARHAGGKPDTPTCTTCHTTNLKAPGKTRAGKEIAPMAVSANPKRITDPAEVAKWFRRNCKDVVGRECTVSEKGDVLAYLASQ
ncbi:MAG: DUF1924 domain-containing protein [Hyphomicrobiaceae bacterium]|nr:DUF1924 domain-containing protein [Hyphomicrobiaceae bacterium]